MTFSTDNFDRDDDSKARRLTAQGDMGYRPGNKFPLALGASDSAQIVLATVGATPELRRLNEQYWDEQRAYAYPKIFGYKVRARRKIAFMKRIDARRYEITEVTFNDPHILPRLIKADEFINLYSGIAYANSKGAVFNVHVTINWRDLGYGTGELAEASLYKSFIRKYTEWCRDNNLECIWIYSNESSDRVGLHTHFMTSIPESRLPDFEHYVTKRIRKINMAGTLLPNAFRISVPKRRVVERQWIRFQYLCKGMDQNAMLKHANGFDKVFANDLVRFGYESPGDVSCKRRCGMSMNLRKPARNKAEFTSLLENGILNTDLLYSDDTLLSKRKSWEEIMEILKQLEL